MNCQKLPSFGSLTAPGSATADSSAPQRSISDWSGSAKNLVGPPPAEGTYSATAPAPVKISVGPRYVRAYALVIGMDDYASLPKLNKAVKDSVAVSEALKAHGFLVTHKTNIKAHQLREAVEDFFYQTGSDKDAALFFWYAGDGYSIGGEWCRLPIDTPALAGGDLEFRRKAYSMRNFGTSMREARSQHILAVFDS